ncbi:potassium channel family protein [Shimia thalassica]|uniref:potassium channel family protein n=1 Tax=Shimia thalassica TaxID=1715693 RepID=UPI001C080B5F|nr:potassium channel family protein [Shimia thalassica]MBU2943396.1 potassium channel family protein [Shimia thalassica]MDO6501465.1 potassium channel family protein [Shimia thalassica]MDO6797667.1 potassium channel family protein [Shimia thalassica]MDP2578976.1 potassium channel family protein [Shimia thalassica]
MMEIRTTGLHWGVLLIFLVSSFFVGPVFGPSLTVQVISLTLFDVAIVGAAIAAFKDPRARTVGIVIAIVWLIVSLVALNVGAFQTLALVLTGVMLLAALWITFQVLLNQTTGNLEALLGAIFGYLLLAMAWAMLYLHILRLDNDAIQMALDSDIWSSVVYYSIVTITSLGYGDILPISPLARMVAGFEAIVGVLYIAIMIGSIVGKFQTPDNGD